MVDMNRYAGAKTFSADDLNGQSYTLVIEDVYERTFEARDGKPEETKAFVSFVGAAAVFGLNVINTKSIIDLVGSANSADWIGKQITLYPTTCEMGGKRVPCIRVDPNTRAVAPQRPAVGDLGPPTPLEPEPQPVRRPVAQREAPPPPLTEDDIPF